MFVGNLVSRLFAIAASIALSACASGYAEFYKPVAGATPERIASMRAAPPGEPIVDRVSPPADTGALVDAYAKRGYVLIGTSSFNSGSQESESGAIEQARKVGADLVVILNPRYTGSTTTAMPMTTPTTTTSYSTGTATAYGAGGTVTAYGSGTTTTYGTKTTYIPLTVHRSDYGAGYFIKQRWGLGVIGRDLNDAERQELQSNKGYVVRIVVDGTPAFMADILPGDIITAVNGESLAGQEDAFRVVRERAGQKVRVSIVRRGQKLEKDVQLN